MVYRTLEEMRKSYPDVNNAFWFAVRAHRGQWRKDKVTPYIHHPVEVAEIVCTMSDVPSVVAAALLHDTVEDTSVRLNDIIRLFGAYVGDLVSDETENKRRSQAASDTWRIRKEEAIRKIAGAGSEAKMISLADKLSNLRSIRKALEEQGEVIWTWFNNSSVSDQAWYYRSMRDQYIGLKHTQAWKEYADLVETIFASVVSEEPLNTDDITDIPYEDLPEISGDNESEEEGILMDETPVDVTRIEDQKYY